MALLTWLWNGLRWLWSLVTPWTAWPGWSGLSSTLRWVLHFLVILLVVLLLGYVNYLLDLERSLRSPFPWLHRYCWLPVLFLLVYALAWLGWWLWRLAGPGREPSRFPEIDRAWDEATRALSLAGIDLKKAPLFLLLGKPRGTAEALFNASGLLLQVRQTPRWPGAPLLAYATADAVFVVATETSLLGRHASLLAEPHIAPRAGGPSGRLDEMQSLLEKAKAEGRGPDQLTEEEKHSLSLLVALEHAEKPAEAARTLTRSPEEVERTLAQLEHVCRLVARDRRPYCPINGVLLLIPLAATDDETVASQTATLCQQDLAVVRRVTQLRCPVFGVVCDLERAEGITEFLARLPAGQLRRLGQRFPLAPDLDPEKVPAMIDDGIAWVCESLLPSLVYNLFRADVSGGDMGGFVRDYARLFRFLAQMKERRPRLTRILVRGALPSDKGPPLLGGCYLAATGADAAREQAFVQGIFERLLENQDYVTWTEEALHEEAELRRLTAIGFGGLSLFLVGVAAMWYFWWRA
jgi:hypothetical protein